MGMVWPGSQHTLTLKYQANFQDSIQSEHALLLNHFIQLSLLPAKPLQVNRCGLGVGKRWRKRKQRPG